ncbi:MAG: Conserved protein YqhG [Brockia lithotrophica]|uniref:Conserved protein YqhG n=1 Tax=Brockia lithotrophica TaxID=933949 RepID=A0A2T5G698_9BACL|nr:hypothetical protein [Brockia lithotrophica]PTQ51710.1 MAG: Conserved protein YqhG [Brockia lithotrophica]
MDPETLRFLTVEYFRRTGSEILEEGETFLRVRLAREADLELGYRPMYWSFADAGNLTPELLEKTYRFYFPGSDVRPTPPSPYGGGEEWLTPTSERLRRILYALARRGSAVRLYESPQRGRGLLAPWYAFTVRVRLFREIAREYIASYGYDAVRGEIVPEFWGRLLDLPLGSEPPPYARLLPAIRSSEGAAHAVVERILGEVRSDLGWAKEARARLAEEMRRLDSVSSKPSPENPKSGTSRREVVEAHEPSAPEDGAPSEPEFGFDPEKERESLLRRYRPRIRLAFVQVALVYLTSDPRDLPAEELALEPLRRFAGRFSAGGSS